MLTFLLVVQAIVAVLLVGVILMQQSEGGGLGMGGGSPTGLMSARGAADFLTRATTVLASIFIGLSILHAVLATQANAPAAIDTSLARQPAPTTDAPPVPLAGQPAPTGAPVPLPGAVPLANTPPAPVTVPLATAQPKVETPRTERQQRPVAQRATAPRTAGEAKPDPVAAPPVAATAPPAAGNAN
jgi:preprotein translocase subunit SecG